ncbi:MAG TPA: carboxypeptidase-like regulatory domain-containing protein [Patescibacteria group bacterium]|nr:carboxypeptidase-like regulatory domain-containing protein [Patescibacteria group bacterium]
MASLPFLTTALLLSTTLTQAAEPATDKQSSGPALIAIVPPLTALDGRVLTKDGVTPVSRAEVRLIGAVDHEPRLAFSDRAGRFKVRLPAGRYTLTITRGMEIYEARSVYTVPAGGRVGIDFLLLPDFEKPGGPAASPPAAQDPAIIRGPDPRPDAPVVVGSVVDIMRTHTKRRLGRWGEALGFIASLLAVALAAN